MYIIKNALKCISRSKGRSILIGIIVLVIAVSACVGLSIRQAAEKAKLETLEGLTVTASIAFDRQSMMSQIHGDTNQSGGGQFDKGQFSSMMSSASSLSLEEYQIYAQADSVKDFYYTLSVTMNGADGFSPVTTEMEEAGAFSGGKGSMGGFSSSDFTLIGYSSELAMTAFQSGTAFITDGSIFEEGTERPECIVSEELALFNNISVGDTIVLANPNNEEEQYTLTVVGLYTDSASNANAFNIRGSTSSDPANQICLSDRALTEILNASKAASSTVTNENTGTETQTAMTGTVTGTYVFADAEAFHRFEEEVRVLGLPETYTVSSADLSAYENSLMPLNTLSTAAGWFLLVILAIGAIILIVLNIFNVRERKYEIGVLTAMGMHKRKVAAQFLTEIFVVTLAAVVIGAGIGAVSSVPVTNALLENQIASQTAQADQIEQNFGRGDKFSGASTIGSVQQTAQRNNYISEISSATDLTVIAQMLGIAVLLTLLSGAASMLFIMRYEPLKILANRD